MLFDPMWLVYVIEKKIDQFWLWGKRGVTARLNTNDATHAKGAHGI